MSDIVERLRTMNPWNDLDWPEVAKGAADEIGRLRKALGEQFCPRPCNNRPDDFSIADCVSAGECGCSARAALDAVKETGR